MDFIKQILKIPPIVSSLILILSFWLAIVINKQFSLPSLREILSFIPAPLITILGVMQLLTWVPIMLAAAYRLGPNGINGLGADLETSGIYRYVRNPLYSGIGSILIGIGFSTNQIVFLIASVIWFLLINFICKKEEIELAKKFGERYLEYKKKTPKFIPNFNKMVARLAKKR